MPGRIVGIVWHAERGLSAMIRHRIQRPVTMALIPTVPLLALAGAKEFAASSIIPPFPVMKERVRVALSSGGVFK